MADEEILKRLHLRRLRDVFKKTRRVLVGKGSLFQGNIAREILDYYGADNGHQIDRKTGNLGYGLIHYALIRNIKPERILCIGSRQGFIPAICALACRDNNFGKVDFVDAGYDRDNEKHWSGVGFWKKIDVKNHFSFLGLDKWIDTHIMTSADFANKYPERKYGYIYIDGDHSYEGVKQDYDLFWPKFKKGGFMVFHDATVKKWGKLKGFGVWKLWEEIPNSHKITFPLKQSGLGILQKP